MTLTTFTQEGAGILYDIYLLLLFIVGIYCMYYMFELIMYLTYVPPLYAFGIKYVLN